MGLRANLKDGTSELVASAAGQTEGEVRANLVSGSLTGSAKPDVEVPLASGRSVPYEDIDSFTPEP